MLMGCCWCPTHSACRSRGGTSRAPPWRCTCSSARSRRGDCTEVVTAEAREEVAADERQIGGQAVCSVLRCVRVIGTARRTRAPRRLRNSAYTHFHAQMCAPANQPSRPQRRSDGPRGWSQRSQTGCLQRACATVRVREEAAPPVRRGPLPTIMRKRISPPHICT
jgi:hypothetical protein